MKHTTIVKLFILLLIIIVPFVSYKHLGMLESTVSKVVMLIIIAATSFYNMEVAILLTVLFLLIVISSNKAVIEAKVVPVMPKTTEKFIMKEFPASECATNTYIAQKDTNPYNFFIDDKIKPYEEYIKRIAPPEQVELAASGHL